MNVEIIKNGGWHFTSIKNPEDIFYKLSNFMHHLEFEYSGLTVQDMEMMIAEINARGRIFQKHLINCFKTINLKFIRGALK